MLNDLLLAIGILALPSLAISLSRITMMGFKPFMAVQIVLVLTIWLTWLFSTRLSYHIRTSILLIALGIATFAALSQIGPAADSKIFMVFFAFSCILFFQSRTAWLLVLAIISLMGLFGFAAVQHWITFELDYQAYSHHPLSWLITTWNMGIFSSVFAYMGWRMIIGLREQSESAQELANRLQKISEHIPGVIYQFKQDTNGVYSFPYASEGIQDIYHVSPDQVKLDATPAFSAIHPDDKERVIASIKNSAEKMTEWRQEYRTLFPDGKVRWLSGDSQPQLDAQGNILWHGFICDITERKNIERLKDEFVATVSHELRTPLTSIRGAIRLINSGILQGKEEEIKHMLNIAEKNSSRLLLLIEDLLNIEKLQSDNLSLKIKNIDLLSFIQECIEENHSYAEQCSVTLNLVQCDAIKVDFDPQRMKQVLANLISNACKFSPTGGMVNIECKQHNEWFSITVTDFGAGIPHNFRDKIFDSFIQADASDTRTFGGTGLGLAIVKKIIELHGGNVSFNTKIGKGTSFIVKLPLKS